MQVFPTASGGGEALATSIGVPFLGRLPLDEKMTGSCEEGLSFLEEYPDSEAAPAFEKIVTGL
jgi:nitrogenase subunit NifH